jgi:colanic acid biosynthesis glycosyl transferase WcaI
MTTILVTQHYIPDDTSTAAYMATIAHEISRDDEVVVLSGTPGSRKAGGKLRVVELPNWYPPKHALFRRFLAMTMFGAGVFVAVLRWSTPTTPLIVVTTPFLLPYIAVLAAWLKRGRTALIVYDLYPEALINSGLTSETSLPARLIRRMNEWLYNKLDAIVIIGRDMEKHFAGYRAPTADKLVYIPNWATLPAGVRPLSAYRENFRKPLVVGLSGNLGFTHDPDTVFAAAQHLTNEPNILFLLSGWGVGWERLKRLQQEATLPNVRIIERVPEEHLDDFLAAADIWIIPYRKHMAGISVPSRLYNLLAIGRPIIALAEPDAEHALMLSEHDAGWVVPPENPAALADTIRRAVAEPTLVLEKGERAVSIIASRFTREAASAAYRALARQLRRSNTTLGKSSS